MATNVIEIKMKHSNTQFIVAYNNYIHFKLCSAVVLSGLKCSYFSWKTAIFCSPVICKVRYLCNYQICKLNESILFV